VNVLSTNERLWRWRELAGIASQSNPTTLEQFNARIQSAIDLSGDPDERTALAVIKLDANKAFDQRRREDLV
jgi:hypothetical protein